MSAARAGFAAPTSRGSPGVRSAALCWLERRGGPRRTAQALADMTTVGVNPSRRAQIPADRRSGGSDATGSSCGQTQGRRNSEGAQTRTAARVTGGGPTSTGEWLPDRGLPGHQGALEWRCHQKRPASGRFASSVSYGEARFRTALDVPVYRKWVQLLNLASKYSKSAMPWPGQAMVSLCCNHCQRG